MKLNRVAQAVVAAELPIIVAMAPLLLFPTPARLLVLCVVPPIWILARFATGRAVPNTPLNACLLVILAMTGLSLWATFDVLFSLGKVSGVVLGVLLFWAVVRSATTSARLMAGVVVYVMAGAALAVIGLLGTQWSEKFSVFIPLISTVPRLIRGIPGAAEGFNPNAVAGCLVLFVPLQWTLLLSRDARRLSPTGWPEGARSVLIAVQVALLLLTAGTILLLQSRGAWLGLIVAATACLLWQPKWWMRLIAVAGAGMTVIALAVTGLDFLLGGSGTVVPGLPGRVEVWSRALYGIQDFAFTGMGMNNFRRVMPLFYPTFLVSTTADVAHAHNHLLQAALDLGLPGLVGYLSVWLVAGGLLVASHKRTADPATRALVRGLGAALVAHFVFSSFDAVPLGAKVGILFWFALGLTVALHGVVFQGASRGAINGTAES
jgi:putative inorganic carbon (hco3(-)) transporter